MSPLCATVHGDTSLHWLRHGICTGGPKLARLVRPRQIHTMRPTALQTLTWATVAAAVASALWLAAVEPDPGVTLRLTALPSTLLSLARPGESSKAADAARRRSNDPAAARPHAQR